MPLKHSSNIEHQMMKVRHFLNDDAPRIVGVEAKRHIASNFRQQGFVDIPFKKWQDRKTRERTRRATLVKTGRLKRSFDYKPTRGRVKVFSSDVPYAQIHNEGGSIKGNQKVRSHFRTRGGNRHRVRSFNRNVNINIPKRQFMGDSKVLNFRINKRLLKKIGSIMNNT